MALVPAGGWKSCGRSSFVFFLLPGLMDPDDPRLDSAIRKWEGRAHFPYRNEGPTNFRRISKFLTRFLLTPREPRLIQASLHSSSSFFFVLPLRNRTFRLSLLFFPFFNPHPPLPPAPQKKIPYPLIKILPSYVRSDLVTFISRCQRWVAFGFAKALRIC